MLTVQLVSKAIAPPWNDGTKCIARALLTGADSCAFRFLGTSESSILERPNVRYDVVTNAGTKFQPGIREHGKALLRVLLNARAISLYHCLFTPNPRTSGTLRVVLKATRRPTVQTICSSPADWASIGPLLFADRTVTVSRWARKQLEQQGIFAEHIPPGIDLPVPDAVAMGSLLNELSLGTQPCVLFSGDYEYSNAHDVVIGALSPIVKRCPTVVVVFACRAKTTAAAAIESSVRQRISDAGLLHRVRFLGEVKHFESLLALSSVVIFPAQSLYRKMDVPITLLQALALRKPIVVSELPALLELLDERVGLSVPPGDDKALADAVIELLTHDSLRSSMGQAAQRLVTSRYSARGMALAYERLYRSLVTGA